MAGTSNLPTDNVDSFGNRRKKGSGTNVRLTEQAVSNYLKTHKDFLINWLSDNATKEIVEVFAKTLREKNIDNQNKAIVTPRRRSLGLRVSSSGSSMNFSALPRNSITSQIFRRYLDGNYSRKVTLRKDRESFQRMSEDEMFMELIRDVSSELDVNLLCHKILQNVSILTNSDRGSLFLVRGSRDNKNLVSKLFDVTETSKLEDVIHNERNEIKVPFGKGIVGLVALTGKPVNIKNAYEDPRFNQEIDQQTGYRTHSILSMPIVNFEGEVIGVAQIINKITGNHEFSNQDEDVFKKYLIFCGIGLTNAQIFEMSVNEFKRNQLLLHLARGIFAEQTNLEKLVQKIMLDAQELLKCEKSSVFLLEDTLERETTNVNKPANACQEEFRNITEVPNHQNLEDVVFSKGFELCANDETITILSTTILTSSKLAHIAKFVVTTGNPVVISDCDTDGRFGSDPFLDSSGTQIRSVLCMPIHNSERVIIGVTQLTNKVNEQPFNDNDINIIEAFSIFTGLGIHNCQMYENACQLMAKQSVALEVLSFHATAQFEESTFLSESTIPLAEDLHLYEYDFDDVGLDDDGTLKACVRMFLDSDMVNRFKLPYEVLCRWLCTVKKNYRPVKYHNWRHAFNVCQTMFTMLYTGELRPLFDDLEVFTLLAACLCHDLDHRGTNNAFQMKVASPLAMLYSTSVLEHHHFDHSIMILNSEGNNIFQSLSPEGYRHAIQLLEHAILSTDLALYFKKRSDFIKLVEDGERTFAEADKRALLRAMMMTACDVAAITKPWEIQKEVAQLVTAEFFDQGDIERYQLGEQPIPMMDRNKKDELPKMQVGFIDAICSPVYKTFSLLTEKLDPLNLSCEFNRMKWEELAEEHSARMQSVAENGTTDKKKSTQPVGTEDSKTKDDPIIFKLDNTSPGSDNENIDDTQEGDNRTIQHDEMATSLPESRLSSEICCDVQAKLLEGSAASLLSPEDDQIDIASTLSSTDTADVKTATSLLSPSSTVHRELVSLPNESATRAQSATSFTCDHDNVGVSSSNADSAAYAGSCVHDGVLTDQRSEDVLCDQHNLFTSSTANVERSSIAGAADDCCVRRKTSVSKCYLDVQPTKDKVAVDDGRSLSTNHYNTSHHHHTTESIQEPVHVPKVRTKKSSICLIS